MSDLSTIFPPEDDDATTAAPVATAPTPVQQPAPAPAAAPVAEAPNPAHEGGLGVFLAQRAKAIIAGVSTALVGELTALVADQAFEGQVQSHVPPQYAFLTPIVFGLLAGLITHNVPNKPPTE